MSSGRLLWVCPGFPVASHWLVHYWWSCENIWDSGYALVQEIKYNMTYVNVISLCNQKDSILGSKDDLNVSYI